MTSKVSLSFDDAVFRQADKELAGLPLLRRRPTIKEGMRQVGKTVERHLRAILPKPGYPGDKPDLKPLREALETKVIEFENATVTVTGYAWGAGSHGHLIEEGVKPHKITVKTKKVLAQRERGVFGRTVNHPGFDGRHFLAISAEATKPQQASVMSGAIQKAIEENKR